MQETRAQSLAQEDPTCRRAMWGSEPSQQWEIFFGIIVLWFVGHSSGGSEKVMAPHSSTLAWKIPWAEEPGRLQSMGLLRVGHD